MNQAAKLTVPSIYILVFEGDARFLDIQQALDHSGWASEIVREFSTIGTGRLYAAIIVDRDGKPTHLCRLVRRQLAALERRSVGISELQTLSSDEASLLAKTILAARKGRRSETRIELL